MLLSAAPASRVKASKFPRTTHAVYLTRLERKENRRGLTPTEVVEHRVRTDPRFIKPIRARR